MYFFKKIIIPSCYISLSLAWKINESLPICVIRQFKKGTVGNPAENFQRDGLKKEYINLQQPEKLKTGTSLQK